MFKKILYPEKSIAWVQLEKNSFTRRLLASHGKRAISFQKKHLQLPTAPSASTFDGDLQTLTEGLLYPCCIDAEMTLRELYSNETLLRSIYSKWSSYLEATKEQVSKVFEKHSPERVLLVQGYEPSNWFARELAIKHELPLLTIENTALKNKVIWESYSGVTVNRNQSENFYWRYFDSIKESEVQKWWYDLAKSIEYQKSSEHQSPALKKKIPHKNKPILLFLGQVYTDSSILFGSKQWRSPIELMEAALTIAKDLEAFLMVKLHPKEASGKAPVIHKPYNQLTYRKMLESPFLKEEMARGEHILVDSDNSWNTYDLIEQATLAITMNSQAGLEAQMRNTPTIVAGHSFYGNFSGVHTTSNKEQLKLAIQCILNSEHLEEKSFQARLFSYIFFEKYCVNRSENDIIKKLLSIH